MDVLLICDTRELFSRRDRLGLENYRPCDRNAQFGTRIPGTFLPGYLTCNARGSTGRGSKWCVASRFRKPTVKWPVLAGIIIFKDLGLTSWEKSPLCLRSLLESAKPLDDRFSLIA
jgi:hypothetical protein